MQARALGEGDAVEVASEGFAGDLDAIEASGFDRVKGGRQVIYVGLHVAVQKLLQGKRT